MAVRQRAVATLPMLMRILKKESPNPRAFSLYDQINLIDNVPQDQLRFQGYTDTGFTVNGVTYEGSCFVLETCYYLGSQRNFPRSLQIEILVLGRGRQIEPVDSELRRFICSTGMKLEAVDSVCCCMTSLKYLCTH
ncbi:hypothetical protein RJ639_002859 [Escallonia herrerae]|uniref:Uncharacterized protein n=1 Tax=Escallonia herrerae TaxID=1293975 RepID=A0AA88W195_9ASTE|nr:hypothetical protein RJ639_002859 [Escallonia herrerae]